MRNLSASPRPLLASTRINTLLQMDSVLDVKRYYKVRLCNRNTLIPRNARYPSMFVILHSPQIRSGDHVRTHHRVPLHISYQTSVKNALHKGVCFLFFHSLLPIPTDLLFTKCFHMYGNKRVLSSRGGLSEMSET